MKLRECYAICKCAAANIRHAAANCHIRKIIAPLKRAPLYF